MSDEIIHPRAATVCLARERTIRRHFKRGASIHTLAWWYHLTEAEIEAIIRRGFGPKRWEAV